MNRPNTETFRVEANLSPTQPRFQIFFFFAGQSGPGPECRLMSDIQTYLTVETIIDLGGDFNWLQGLSSSK